MAEAKEQNPYLHLAERLTGYVAASTGKDEISNYKHLLAEGLIAFFKDAEITVNNALRQVISAIGQNRQIVNAYNARVYFWQKVSNGKLEETLLAIALELIEPAFQKLMQERINAIKPQFNEEGKSSSIVDSGRFSLKIKNVAVDTSGSLRKQVFAAGITNKNCLDFVESCVNQEYFNSSIYVFKTILLKQFVTVTSNSSEDSNLLTLQNSHLTINITPNNNALEIEISIIHDIYTGFEANLNSKISEIHKFNITEATLKLIAENKLTGAWAENVRSKLVLQGAANFPAFKLGELLSPLCDPQVFDSDRINKFSIG